MMFKVRDISLSLRYCDVDVVENFEQLSVDRAMYPKHLWLIQKY